MVTPTVTTGVDPKFDTYTYEGITYRLPTWGQYRKLLKDVRAIQTLTALEQIHDRAYALLKEWTVGAKLDALSPSKALGLAGSLPSILLYAEVASKKASASTTH